MVFRSSGRITCLNPTQPQKLKNHYEHFYKSGKTLQCRQESFETPSADPRLVRGRPFSAQVYFVNVDQQGLRIEVWRNRISIILSDGHEHEEMNALQDCKP